MNINNAIELLKCYSGPFELTLHPRASEALIQKVEHFYGVTLPDDFKTLYRFTDGFEIDEDILNMIPLQEMISHKNADKSIWIAEYMIYSEMWELEIDSDNFNDYSILADDMDHGKIALTHSVAEFVGRCLKGGVFEKGGLYHWKDEIKAKVYGNVDPEGMKPLFAVFSECLKLDLISKHEVTERADWIISTEHDPHPFFKRISASRAVPELITVLNSVDLIEDIVQVRAIFGVVALKLLINKIKPGKAISILAKFTDRKDLTPYETNEIRYLVNERRRWYNRLDKTLRIKLSDRTKSFFDNYSRFNLYYHTNWNAINDRLVSDFSAGM